MKKLYLCLAFLFSILTTSYSQTSYTGNGASGFGGPVGGATMTLDDDGTTITATFTSKGKLLYIIMRCHSLTQRLSEDSKYSSEDIQPTEFRFFHVGGKLPT